MRKALILILGLAGCGQNGDIANRATPVNRADRIPIAPGSAPVQTATLTGLYEGGGARPSQMCVVERDGRARFGLVTWQGERPGCSGAGAAVRTGNLLRLTMDGESACAIDARITGSAVAFPTGVPRGCAYYCAPGAPLSGLTFAKTGGANTDALRARDLVGDPLCG